MKNLHLMPMGSIFDDDLVTELNANFPEEWNVFYHAEQREKLMGVSNSKVVPDAFTPESINNHAGEYNRIFLHSLFLSPDEILKLDDEAAKKIVWIVWGHDLYTVQKKQAWTTSLIVKESIHIAKKILRGTYIRAYRKKREVAKKVGLFHAIGIGYSYDEKEIRKKYGKKVPVVYGPYFSKPDKSISLEVLREMHLSKNDPCTNILIGHSGFEFLEHEKNLKLLEKYKSEKIHIYLVLSYGASDERIKKLRSLAESIYGKEKVTIITEMMEKRDYFHFLTTIDIAIFSFKHQSALANTMRMAYMGTKLYLHPNGVLAKGFQNGGVRTYNCKEIGKVSFSIFVRVTEPVNIEAPMFQVFNYQRSVEAWRTLLTE